MAAVHFNIQSSKNYICLWMMSPPSQAEFTIYWFTVCIIFCCLKVSIFIKILSSLVSLIPADFWGHCEGSWIAAWSCESPRGSPAHTRRNLRGWCSFLRTGARPGSPRRHRSPPGRCWGWSWWSTCWCSRSWRGRLRCCLCRGLRIAYPCHREILSSSCAPGRTFPPWVPSPLAAAQSTSR